LGGKGGRRHQDLGKANTEAGKQSCEKSKVRKKLKKGQEEWGLGLRKVNDEED